MCNVLGCGTHVESGKESCCTYGLCYVHENEGPDEPTPFAQLHVASDLSLSLNPIYGARVMFIQKPNYNGPAD